jgi:hypothetical protein
LAGGGKIRTGGASLRAATHILGFWFVLASLLFDVAVERVYSSWQ